MARKKFLRRNHDKYSRLGGRRKKLVWRRQRGRHGKMREGRKGYPSIPKIGRRNQVHVEIKLIGNMKQLLEIKKGEEVIIRRIGNKKRKEMENKAKELGIKIINLKEEQKGKLK